MPGIAETAMRAVSCLFHLLLGMVLMVLSLTYLLSPQATFRVGILPWEGETLAWVLLAAGSAGVVLVYLASRRVFAVGLQIWSVAVLAALVWGCFLGSHHFGRDGATVALLLVAGAAVAALGSWLGFSRRPARLSSYRAERPDLD